jgi:uncharacterized protein DUF6912
MSQPIRVYLPATVPVLARLHAEGAVAVTEGYAVTPALRAQLGGETDEEELSYAAYRLAADASLRLLRADPAAPERRVVISADVPAEPAHAGEAGAVRPAGPVPVAAVAAIHIDGAAAGPAVAGALATGDGSVDDELEWYDASELSQLLA